jgi:hypothetical protein
VADLRAELAPRIFMGLVPILLVALPLLLGGLHMVREAGLLDREGRLVDARVDRLWIERRRASSSQATFQSFHWVEYTFSTRSGTTVTGRTEIPQKEFIRLDLDRTTGRSPVMLPVLYLPDDPTVNAPTIAPRAREGIYLQLAAFAIAAVASLPLIGAWRYWRAEMAWRRR